MPLSDARETGANALIPRVAGGRRASETTQCASPSAASPLGIGRAIRTVRSRAVPHSPKENGGASAGGSQAARRVSAHCACSRGSKPRARVSAVCVDPGVETNRQGDESFGSESTALLWPPRVIARTARKDTRLCAAPAKQQANSGEFARDRALAALLPSLDA